MYSNDIFPNAFRCSAVRVSPFIIFPYRLSNLASNHPDSLASLNSHSFTTDAGSSDFINENTAPTSQGQFADFREAIISPPALSASSNDLTCGLE